MIKFLKNIGQADQMLRLAFSEVLLLIGFFWLPFSWSLFFFIGAIILSLSGVTGASLVYWLFKVTSFSLDQRVGERFWKGLIFALVLIPLLGGMGSYYYTKKVLIADFNVVNDSFQKVLFSTMKNQRDVSIAEYEKFLLSFDKFRDKYSDYHPVIIKGDWFWNFDLQFVYNRFINLRQDIYRGNLSYANNTMLKDQTDFYAVIKRNHLSPVAVAFANLHDKIDLISKAANKQNARAVMDIYAETQIKLLSLEKWLPDLENEMKVIRQDLNALYSAAEANRPEEMPALSVTLQKNFNKQYIKIKNYED